MAFLPLAFVFQNCARPYAVEVAPFEIEKLGSAALILNGGVPYTQKIEVDVDSSVEVGMLPEIYLTEARGCASGGEWTSYRGGLKWTFAGDDGQKFLFAKFKKSDGTETGCAAAEITLDRLAPTLEFLVKPDEVTGNSYADFKIEAADNASGIALLECRLGSREFQLCTKDMRFEGLAVGNHSFEARVRDAAGNTSPTLRHEWGVDSTIPEILLTSSIPGGVALDGNVTFTFTADDGVGGSGIERVVCQLDNQPEADCQSPVTLSNLSEGPHTFKAYAVDKTKRRSSVATKMWAVDVNPPTVTLTAAPPTFVLDGLARISFTGSDAGSGIAKFVCQLDEQPERDCVSGISIATTEGPHVLKVRSVDKAERRSAWASASFTTDLAAPVLTFTRFGAEYAWSYPEVAGYVTMEWTVADGLGSGYNPSRTWVTIAGTGRSCSGVGDCWIDKLARGPHTLTIEYYDRAGRRSVLTRQVVIP